MWILPEWESSTAVGCAHSPSASPAGPKFGIAWRKPWNRYSKSKQAPKVRQKIQKTLRFSKFCKFVKLLVGDTTKSRTGQPLHHHQHSQQVSENHRDLTMAVCTCDTTFTKSVLAPWLRTRDCDACWAGLWYRLIYVLLYSHKTLPWSAHRCSTVLFTWDIKCILAKQTVTKLEASATGQHCETGETWYELIKIKCFQSWSGRSSWLGWASAPERLIPHVYVHVTIMAWPGKCTLQAPQWTFKESRTLSYPIHKISRTICLCLY